MGMYALLTAEAKPAIVRVHPGSPTIHRGGNVTACGLPESSGLCRVGCNGCATMAEAIAYRKTFACTECELMLIWPDLSLITLTDDHERFALATPAACAPAIRN